MVDILTTADRIQMRQKEEELRKLLEAKFGAGAQSEAQRAATPGFQADAGKTMTGILGAGMDEDAKRIMMASILNSFSGLANNAKNTFREDAAKIGHNAQERDDIKTQLMRMQLEQAQAPTPLHQRGAQTAGGGGGMGGGLTPMPRGGLGVSGRGGTMGSGRPNYGAGIQAELQRREAEARRRANEATMREELERRRNGEDYQHETARKIFETMMRYF